MEKIDVEIDKFASIVLSALNRPGLLLVSMGKTIGPNVMTIGWGFMGVLWGLPMFVAFVRPSRYTHQVLEEAGDFTINVPAKDMEKAVSICGTISGRTVDKFKEARLNTVPSKRVKSPIIRQCIAHLECLILYRIPLEAKRIPHSIKELDLGYSRGDYHDVYFGEIVEAYADKDYKKLL
ncbi:MAG: flavin reductase family protein [Thermoproteota archaeon]